MIRLFTSGTHNGLNFSNAQVTDIATKTRQQGADRIPFVLGHPKNDLPIVGFLPKEAVILYHENEKMSIGFDREQGDFSEESLDMLRKIGNNKISVRLVDGVIKHIGLVEKAAVAENNQQDFADSLTGYYHTNEDFLEKPASRFPNPLNFFKPNKIKSMDNEKEKGVISHSDFADLKTVVERNSKTIENIAKTLAKQQSDSQKQQITAEFSAPEYDHLSDEQKKQAADFCTELPAEQREPYKKMLRELKPAQATPPSGSVTAEFSAPEYDHLSDEQKKQAADFCAGLPAEQREPYKKMLRELKPAQATPPSGSVTAEFGAQGAQELSAEELIRQQVKAL